MPTKLSQLSECLIKLSHIFSPLFVDLYFVFKTYTIAAITCVHMSFKLSKDYILCGCIINNVTALLFFKLPADCAADVDADAGLYFSQAQSGR